MKYQLLLEFEVENEDEARQKARKIKEDSLVSGVDLVELERIDKEWYGDSLDGFGSGNRYVETTRVPLY